jgi:hypothetical protein
LEGKLYMQVAEVAFLGIDDLEKVGARGAEGIKLLTACKNALTAHVLLPFLHKLTNPKQGSFSQQG